LTKLREEKGAVDAELAAARKALSTSSVPEIAELNTMRDSLSTAKTENERLQKRLGNLQSEIEYMRNSCQQANTAAADAANELTSAQDEIASLKQKADANTLQIHQIQHSNEIAQHLKRIGGLETENKELEKDLERKSEELRTLLNARRQTRGSSAPRSPRMGTQGSIMGTMSPRPIGRVMGIPVTGGSRGNSPGPGEMPVRGMWAGEVLFQGPQARWGNHLQ
jgi:chromosome segregation ATPase